MFGFGFGNVRWSGLRGQPFSFGNGLKFLGVNDLIKVGNNPILFDTSQPFILSFWCKLNATGVTQAIGLFRTNIAANQGLQFVFRSVNTISIAIRGINKQREFNFTQTTTKTHFALYYNGSGHTTASNYTLYINGVANTPPTDTNTTVGALTTTTSAIGSLSTTPIIPFIGMLDEIGIAHNTVTQAQINELFNGGNGADFKSIFPNTKVYYRLNEGIGNTANDESGENNHGELVGFTTTSGTDCPFDADSKPDCAWQPFDP